MEKPTIKQMNDLLEHLRACGELDDSDKQIEQMANQVIALLKENLALMEEVAEKKKLLVSYGEMLHESGQQTDLAIKRIAQIKADNQALKAVTDNIYDNIKNLPAGHERFALDCIRRLLKPMEQERNGHAKEV